MKKLLVVIIMGCSTLTYAQKKKDLVTSDTLKFRMSASEMSILSEYESNYRLMQQNIQVIQESMEQLKKSYGDLLKFKVESLGGDSKKMHYVKSDTIYFIKPKSN